MGHLIHHKHPEEEFKMNVSYNLNVQEIRITNLKVRTSVQNIA